MAASVEVDLDQCQVPWLLMKLKVNDVVVHIGAAKFPLKYPFVMSYYRMLYVYHQKST